MQQNKQNMWKKKLSGVEWKTPPGAQSLEKQTD